MCKLLFLYWLLLCQLVSCSIHILSSNDTHFDKAAAFGPRIDRQGILGKLMYAPHNGCVPCAAPTLNWIAIVDRGGCSFVDKVRILQSSGADAVIIGDRHRNSWVTMYAKDNDASDIHIPSVFVAQYQFLSLLQHLEDQEGMALVRITENDMFAWSYSDILLFFAVLLPSSILYSLYLTWRICQQHQYQREQQRIAAQQTKAPAELVQRLPTKLFHKESTSTDQEDEDEECIICLETYQEGNLLRKLPCRHEFHAVCIDTWLTTRRKFCPICKYDVCRLRYQPNENTPLLLA